MTLQDFAATTITVIQENGIEGYLPTLLFPDTKEIRVIEGIPEEIDHREAVQNVVRRSGYDKQEFMFGVNSAPGEIILGHYRPGQSAEFMKITEAKNGYATCPLAQCSWWKIAPSRAGREGKPRRTDLRLAGTVRGAKNLSSRKGFSKG